MVCNGIVYGPLRVKALTIKDTKLRWKIPKNFPDEHRPSNGLYTVLPNVFISLLNSNFQVYYLILQENFPQSIPY